MNSLGTYPESGHEPCILNLHQPIYMTDQHTMTNHYLKSPCSPTLFCLPDIGASLALCFTLSLFSCEVSSQPGYAQRVKTECAKAGRPVPGFSVNNCNICHQNANNLLAYQSGNFLDVLCQIGTEPVEPDTNTAPVLEHLSTPQTALLGQVFQLPVVATDAEDDVIKLSAKSLPPGASLKQGGKVNGKWTATLRWKPKKKQAGKSFNVKLIATEKKRKPKLVASQSIRLFVAEPTTIVQTLTVEQSRYESGILNISGRVSHSTANSIGVLIEALNGTPLGRTESEGSLWSASIPVAAENVPCAIRVAVSGAILAVAPVHTTQAGCR